MQIVRDADRPSGVHERREEYLASGVRIGPDNDPNRSKQGNGHCSGGFLESGDRIVSRSLNAAP